MYSYKVTHSSLDAFFMRRYNFSKLLNDVKEFNVIHSNFIKFILLDYIQQIYLPI